MKAKSCTVKLTASGHKMAYSMSCKFGVSMAALVEIGLRHLSTMKNIELPPRDPRSLKTNSRRALRAA